MPPGSSTATSSPRTCSWTSKVTCRIVDFGIARVANADRRSPTPCRAPVLGTAGYLSPEQAGGEPATSASDVYSLGLVARESAPEQDCGAALSTRGLARPRATRCLPTPLSAAGKRRRARSPPSAPRSARSSRRSLSSPRRPGRDAGRRIPLVAAAALVLLAGRCGGGDRAQSRRGSASRGRPRATRRRDRHNPVQHAQDDDRAAGRDRAGAARDQNQDQPGAQRKGEGERTRRSTSTRSTRGARESAKRHG